MCAFKHTNTYRHYDPYSQKFLSEDPIGFAAGDNNLYRYVFNNPVLLTDPTGEFVPLVYVAAFIGGIMMSNIANAPTSESDEVYPDQEGKAALQGVMLGYFLGGGEVKVGNDFRCAPLGNRTNNIKGQLPHYHRRGTGPGQGIKRHRPWDKKETDKSFWDLF